MIKEYIIKKTAKAFAKANGLRDASEINPYVSDVYYDFSLFDDIKWDNDYERKMLEDDIIRHNSTSWYEQPLPNLIMYNNFVSYHGQVKTNITRVFKQNGKRMMVIIEVCKMVLTRDVRHSVYEQYYKTEKEYKAENNSTQRPFDLEVA